MVARIWLVEKRSSLLPGWAGKDGWLAAGSKLHSGVGFSNCCGDHEFFIFRSHPHGFWCTGVFTNLLTDATNFEDKYPGLARYLLTLNGQFWFPVRRDVGINLGWLKFWRITTCLQLTVNTSGCLFFNLKIVSFLCAIEKGSLQIKICFLECLR